MMPSSAGVEQLGTAIRAARRPIAGEACTACDRPARGDVLGTVDYPAHYCRQCADHCALTAYYRSGF